MGEGEKWKSPKLTKIYLKMIIFLVDREPRERERERERAWRLINVFSRQKYKQHKKCCVNKNYACKYIPVLSPPR